MDRTSSPAFAVLPQRARKVFAAIERAIGNRSSASVSYTSFSMDHRITLKDVAPAVRLLDHLGLIEVEQGPRNSFGPNGFPGFRRHHGG